MDIVDIKKIPNPTSQQVRDEASKPANEIRNEFELKRGRHPNGCPCERCQTRRAKVSQKNPANANPEIDTTFVKQSVESVLIAGDAVMTQKIYRTSLRLTKDTALSIELAKDGGLTNQEVNAFGTLSERIANKYKFAGKYFDEGCLLVLAIGYATRLFLVFKKLGEYATVKQRIESRHGAKTETESEA